MGSEIHGALNRLHIFNLKGAGMRTFHLAWMMFFVCFFGWFGLAPLMPVIRQEMHLTRSQMGIMVMASVSATVIARLVVGRLCDRWGPRKTAARLLLAGSVPVMLVGLARDYTTLLLFRSAIGIIGASFVIAQYHASVMFAPHLKGRANALVGGWGNLGGGVANIAMPLVFAVIVQMGCTRAEAWRYAMLVPGVMMWVMAWLYDRYTADSPDGEPGAHGHRLRGGARTDWSVLSDARLWALTGAYAMSFGMEITFDGVAALYFVDHYGLSLSRAGLWAGAFGCMNLFARALGGLVSDKAGIRYGMKGKGILLGVMLSLEGGSLIFFAGAAALSTAIAMMIVFALFLKMANGAVYGIVPFIRENSLGLVSGVVGAGGNLGGMLFALLFISSQLSDSRAFVVIGVVIIAVSCVVLMTRFQKGRPRVSAGELSEPMAEGQSPMISQLHNSAI